MGILSGRGVVITGAGRGLGRAYAHAAAAEGAGVVVNDIDAGVAEAVGAEISAAGGTAIVEPGSVTDWQVAERLVERSVQEFGSLDGFIANAGMAHSALPWEEDYEAARRLLEVNLLGTIGSGRAALREMTKQRRGSFITVTSGAQSGLPGNATYSAAKGAVSSYTYSCAVAAMPYGVRVNAIAPVARTPMSMGQTPQASGFGPPELVAPLAVFLLSDLAEGITGQVIFMNGRHLSLTEHPITARPAITRDPWTVEEINTVFREELRAQLRPYGLARGYMWSPGTA